METSGTRQHRNVIYPIARQVLALSLAAGAGGCSYGAVVDAETLAPLGGALVVFAQPDLTGVAETDVAPTFAPPVFAVTWTQGAPGAGDAAGGYYLNPYGTPHAGDTKAVHVAEGWNRIIVSRLNYDTRRIYRNHLYRPCTVAQAQGPYSAGSYPYVKLITGTPTIGFATECAADLFTLYPSTSNHVMEADMIVDKRTLNQNFVATGTSCEGVANRCLRVSVGTANVGDGDLLLIGNANHAGVVQRRFTRNGTTMDTALADAAFVFHPAHHHIHLQNWTNLRLRHVDSTCSTEDVAANCPVVGSPGTKISFCIVETGTFDSTYTPSSATRPIGTASCLAVDAAGTIIQGIGAGRMDTYHNFLAGQMIGIDGLPSGTYWLEVEVNPVNTSGQRTILESDYGNNITRVQVKL
jgi:hypothetical protein